MADNQDIMKGIGNFLFGGSTLTPVSNINQGQQNLLGALTSGGQQQASGLMANLGGMVSDPKSAYDALPDFEATFKQRYGDPLEQQHEMDLANLQNTDELFSGGEIANSYRANRNFQSNLAQARAGMMMDERNKQMQSMDTAYNRATQAANILGNLSLGSATAKTTDTIEQKNAGLLDMIAGIGKTTGVLGQLFGSPGSGATGKTIA